MNHCLRKGIYVTFLVLNAILGAIIWGDLLLFTEDRHTLELRMVKVYPTTTVTTKTKDEKEIQVVMSILDPLAKDGGASVIEYVAKTMTHEEILNNISQFKHEVGKRTLCDVLSINR